MNSAPVFLLATLAALVGFAAQRGGICNVKVVEEIITTHRARMLLCLIKAVVWGVLTTLVLFWSLQLSPPHYSWATSGYTLLGGFLFGVGAVINGGCAVSTVTRLAAGQLGVLLSLAGIALGIGIYIVLTGVMTIPDSVSAPPLLDLGASWSRFLLVVTSAWGAFELLRMVRVSIKNRASGAPARRYTLSVAAAVMGVSNGILYVAVGSWAYTYTLGRAVGGVMNRSVPPALVLWVLLVALILGALASAVHNGDFKLRWKPEVRWLAFLSGGVMMGLGGAMAPGGNDVLLLHAMPSFSPHSIPAFLAMLAGIASSLALARLFGKSVPVVSCSGDVCRG